MPFRRGEVWYAALPEIGDKPVLVVSWDAVSNGIGSPVVCLIASTDRERVFPTYLPIGGEESGLGHDSYVLCHELLTLAGDSFRRHVGTISPASLINVEICLRRVLDLG